MARTANRGTISAGAPALYNAMRWRLGKYIRLSKEDLLCGREQVFDMKRRNGEFIGSYAPYGYAKDPNDKHALLVDPEATEVVKN